MGRQSALAIPANEDKTLYNVFNHSGSCKYTNHRHLQCRCRGVRRFEEHVGGQWRLAKTPKGTHTEKCSTLTLYELAKEQCEIRRQQLVRDGMPLQTATATVNF